MFPRLIRLPHKYSFFLFGARGVGKSTLLKQDFQNPKIIWIDLLNPEQEAYFAKDPNALATIANTILPETPIIIDEVQKLPKLLDVVHSLIEARHQIFILTGSSARKLKRGAANLLAGRAFVYHLFPFSFLELKNTFNLIDTLQYGLLPGIFAFDNAEQKIQYLQSYAYTYLKEEVVSEQLIRTLDPFRGFLEVAAQMNGKIMNIHNIARDVGVDDKTVLNYYSILEDTLLGFFLEPFHHSFRKRLGKQAKFFFFDLGVTRALARTLTLPVLPQTSYYGELFEQMVIIEIYKLCQYFKSEYRLSFIRTKDDLEIDLVVERPGLPLLFIEIKSGSQISTEMLSALKKVHKEFPEAEAICLSQDPYTKDVDTHYES